MLSRLLERIDFSEGAIQTVQAEIEQRLQPYQEAVEQVQTIPGVGPLAAAMIVAEIGVDMSRFPSAKHLASWAVGHYVRRLEQLGYTVTLTVAQAA